MLKQQRCQHAQLSSGSEALTKKLSPWSALLTIFTKLKIFKCCQA